MRDVSSISPITHVRKEISPISTFFKLCPTLRRRTLSVNQKTGPRMLASARVRSVLTAIHTPLFLYSNRDGLDCYGVHPHKARLHRSMLSEFGDMEVKQGRSRRIRRIGTVRDIPAPLYDADFDDTDFADRKDNLEKCRVKT
jgi:hypothetical protein